ncbi:Uncharacterized protein SCG7086_AQ_00030 [Chlamydiales bacterium SCGC AG-110-P3]|nr:Uncharacterized protein SCG7086_AQ_00030 [Chlamydiales bacterium SCGC AG-110-P3]
MSINDSDQLIKFMNQLGIVEDDLVEKFILGSGRGGQKVQKTSSCVYLKHVPSGIEIKCQHTRSREQNRFLARWELCERIKQNLARLQQEIQKKRHIKKQANRGRSKASKAKMVEEKRRTSQKKSMRRPPPSSEDH